MNTASPALTIIRDEVHVRNFRRFQVAPALAVCLGFTGSHVAWADPAQDDRPGRPDLYVEDPYAPHNTTGSEARFGTVVGFLHDVPGMDVLALGASAAAGYRFGRLTLESEFQYFGLQTRGTVMTPLGVGDGDIHVGNGERLAALARFDVIRLGPRIVGPNSLVALYVEGGAAVAWNQWSKPTADEAARIVPDDEKRIEGQVGFGLTIDHRLQEPIGFPHRIAWFIGWRMAVSPHEQMSGTLCRGISCRAITMPDDNAGYTDRSLLFQSSLMFTF